MFTGAALSWPSPALPKFQNGDANFNLTDVSRPSILILKIAETYILCTYINYLLKYGRYLFKVTAL